MENEIMQQILVELKGLKQGLVELRTETAQLGTDLHGEIAELRTELRGEMAEMQDNLQSQIDAIRRSQVTVELVWFPKINAALERTQNIMENNAERDERIAFLEKKADIHDLRLYALEHPEQKAE